MFKNNNRIFKTNSTPLTKVSTLISKPNNLYLNKDKKDKKFQKLLTLQIITGAKNRPLTLTVFKIDTIVLTTTM